MNYNYGSLSDHSLNVLLRQHISLRYEAQLELLEELRTRSFSSEMVADLETTLVEKKRFLKELGFLKEMGFDVQRDGATTIITRRFWPQVIELASILLGVFLVFVGMYGLVTLYNLITGDDSAGLQDLIINGFLVFLGFKGFQMLGGLSRFINYLGMKFSFSEKEVLLQKRVDFKLEKFTGTPNDISVVETEDTLLLKFKEETALVANPKSFVQRATLESLLNNLNNKLDSVSEKDSAHVS